MDARSLPWPATLVVPLLALGLLAAPAVQGQTRLFLGEYQYNNPKLKSMNLDGSGVAELFSPPASDWLIVGCDYDPGAGKIYWTHGSTPGTIRRANLDGTDVELLVSGLKIPRGVSLDLTNGKMYWAQAPPQGNAMGLILRANLDGSGTETFFTLTPYDPVLSYVGKPCVDPVNGYVYFCAAQRILRKRIDGVGPAEVVVRGVTTTTAVALDSEHEEIYFVDANTNSDYFGKARVDDTGFAVLADISPGVNQSSGLFDLRLDLAGGKAYFTDEIAKKVLRCNLDGSGLEQIYLSPSSLAPTSICFDLQPPQPILDCNNNGIRDLDDVSGGGSSDCNGNGVPDECEDDPCNPAAFWLDQGSDPAAPSRSLSGDPQTGYEIFQPFEFAAVPGEDVNLGRIGLDGWTINYHPAGFRVTLFPDDGTGILPDESAPIEAVDFQYRFSPDSVAWEYRPFQAVLPGGRYWLRLTANDPDYDAGANVGVMGEPSLSRRLSDGGIVYSSYPIALRIELVDPASALPPLEGNSPTRLVALDPPQPNPASGTVCLSYWLSRPARVTLGIYDPSGRRVRLLRSGAAPKGADRASWNALDDQGRALRAGIYFVRVEAIPEDGTGPAAAAQRILLIR